MSLFLPNANYSILRAKLFFKLIFPQMPAFYAVARGRSVGIFSSWDECKKNVEKFPNARYKKFSSSAEASAFISLHSTDPSHSSKSTIKKLNEFPRNSNQSELSSISVSESLLQDQQTQGNFKKKLQISTQALNIQTRLFSTSSVDFKRRLKVTEDRVIKKPRLTIASNAHANLSTFKVDESGYVVVYTDGACRSNGKKGAKAGIGVWFADNHPLNVSESVRGSKHTNNAAEIQATIKAMQKAKEAKIDKLCIKTDSQFVINCVTKWMSGWKSRNWKLSNGDPVKNKEDLQMLSIVAEDLEVKWSYVPGHKGEHGNECADRLAVAGI